MLSATTFRRKWEIANRSDRRIAGNRILQIFFTFSIAAYSLLIQGCKRTEACTTEFIFPISPYTNPVWYPDGSLLGFNHIPLQSFVQYGGGPCPPTRDYYYKHDSIGFWLIDADGKNMRRVTNFELLSPSWSPDGKWIAFSGNGTLYKMSFNGSDFDTSHIIQLTYDPSNHYFPVWNVAGDTIFYDSDEADPTKPYQIYKMAADGSGATLIGNRGLDSVYSREPWFCPDGTILHIRGDSVSTHVFSMDAAGGQVRQVTNNRSSHIYIHNPRYFNGSAYFEDYGVWSSSMDGTGLTKIAGNSTHGFTIAPNGTIAYVNFDITDNSPASMPDSTHGVIWLMDPDGNNKRQLTFNNY